MEGELNNFLRLSVMAMASLLYCYLIAAKIPKGLLRLLSLIPVITLLSIIPFNLHSFHIGVPTWCYLAWLANFKLLLFAFEQGPLSSPSSLSPWGFLAFLLTAAFPFKIKQNLSKTNSKALPNSISEASNKAVLLALVLHCYSYKQYFHQQVLLTFYFLYSYFSIQLLLAVGAIPGQLILGLELEPQFNAPLLSTSLQDFWGHRWNLRVSDLLRAAVYDPVRHVSTRMIGPRWASLPAVFVTFFISGLVHELLYHYITRASPTWEVTLFFVLQGMWVDMEIVLKKKMVATNRFRLHRAVSGPLALAYIAVTAAWLSYTQILRHGIDEKITREFNLFVDFLEGTHSILRRNLVLH
ncbi:PREDICTED: probable long-chain-alcohol O-fatty-acyltransferase 5 [Theobroma cacao]|nr:PREDICTED: probable long-chain-alcohol O-fatty-acyltransferase 5 [Theobroma cacao]